MYSAFIRTFDLQGGLTLRFLRVSSVIATVKFTSIDNCKSFEHRRKQNSPYQLMGLMPGKGIIDLASGLRNHLDKFS